MILLLSNNELGANLLILLFLFIIVGLWFLYDWFKVRFNGFSSKVIFCNHPKEFRGNAFSVSEGIFGSIFRKYECKKCGNYIRTQQAHYDNAKEVVIEKITN